MWPILFLVIALAAFAFGAYASPRPVLWFLGAAGLLGAWSVWRSRTLALRIVGINVAAVCMVLIVFEIKLDSAQTNARAERFEGDYAADYFQPHPLFGYGPARDRAARARKFHGDTLIYDVVYTIDANGQRIAPPYRGGRGAPCLAFFGDSLTFGEGVQDGEAMPYRVGLRSGGRYRIVNFAFHGYGPHQMLAALESGWAQSVLDCPAQAAIYQALPTHVMRAAGRAPWDRDGPDFRLLASGAVQHVGRFSDRADPEWPAQRGLERSALYRRIFGSERAIRAREIQLFVAIVQQARELFLRRYPGSEFHILLWGRSGTHDFDRLVAGLRAANFNLHLVSQILPDYDLDAARYELSPHDAHPNAAAHDRIAAYIVTRILGMEELDDPRPIQRTGEGDSSGSTEVRSQN